MLEPQWKQERERTAYEFLRSIAESLSLNPGPYEWKDDAWRTPVTSFAREQIAFHEAAHAIVAMSLHYDIERIVLNADGSGGWTGIGGVNLLPRLKENAITSIEARLLRAGERSIERVLAISLAGPVGDQMRSSGCVGYLGDLDRAVGLALRCWPKGGTAIDRLFAARDRSQRLLTRHEPGWRRLALALRDRSEMDGGEAKKHAFGSAPTRQRTRR